MTLSRALAHFRNLIPFLRVTQERSLLEFSLALVANLIYFPLAHPLRADNTA